jgi:uncharacterized protein (TIGR02246 family)
MTDPRTEIAAIVDARAAAIRAGDAEAIAARIAPDVVSFDVIVPLRSLGAGAVRERLQRWFDSYDGHIGCEVRDLVVRADGDVAFSHALMGMSGTLKSGTAVSMWVRSTIGWERRDGRWLAVHEHMSDPMDPDTGKTRIDLEP